MSNTVVLGKLLRDLIVVQDSITWENTKGREEAPETLEMVKRRNGIRHEIMLMFQLESSRLEFANKIIDDLKKK